MDLTTFSHGTGVWWIARFADSFLPQAYKSVKLEGRGSLVSHEAYESVWKESRHDERPSMRQLPLRSFSSLTATLRFSPPLGTAGPSSSEHSVHDVSMSTMVTARRQRHAGRLFTSC